MAKEWPRIVRIMRDLGRRNEAAPELWSFLEFTVTHRTPLYIVLMPFILHKVTKAVGFRGQFILSRLFTTDLPTADWRPRTTHAIPHPRTHARHASNK